MLLAVCIRRQPLLVSLDHGIWYQSLLIRRRYWIHKIPSLTVGSRVVARSYTGFFHRRRRPIRPRRRSVRPPPPSPTSTITDSPTPPVFLPPQSLPHHRLRSIPNFLSIHHHLHFSHLTRWRANPNHQPSPPAWRRLRKSSTRSVPR